MPRGDDAAVVDWLIKFGDFVCIDGSRYVLSGWTHEFAHRFDTLVAELPSWP
jgi:hypothetical protein